ncbi:hypothetical protein A0H81_02212 [Grifola frondosa]|uniref:Uncharacterized protein n=1 Tax=Grifola frondosa TaxID=5627 RepID=A0A1C7ML55_GRIFR|nr:hypothetical protein A0H81_02212 [Grifola frondosa]
MRMNVQVLPDAMPHIGMRMHQDVYVRCEQQKALIPWSFRILRQLFNRFIAELTFACKLATTLELEKDVHVTFTNKSVQEDAAWFAQDISDVVTLSTPLLSAFPHSPLTSSSSPDLRALPDSLPPLPRQNAASRNSRHSKPLPAASASVLRWSWRGSSSRVPPSTDVLDIKHILRRVVRSDWWGLTFDSFFPMCNVPTPPRPALAPPLFGPTTPCESLLDDIILRFSGLGISLNFPSLPAHDPTRTSSITCDAPCRSPRLMKSPQARKTVVIEWSALC